MFIDPFDRRIDFTKAPWIKGNHFFIKEERDVFMRLTEGILNKVSRVRLDGCYSKESIFRIIHDVQFTNPLAFGLYYVSHVDYPEDNQTDVYLRYRPECDEWKIQISKVVKDLYDEMGIEKCRTDLEIELIVNDWLCEHCVYDMTIKDFHLRHLVVGILLNGRGVCSSFALTTALLLMCFGVKCYPIRGRMLDPRYKQEMPGYRPYEHMKILDGTDENKTEMSTNKPMEKPKNIKEIGCKEYDSNKIEGHAWNYVYIEGKGRHLDVTFNCGHYKGLIQGKTHHSFFNLIYKEIVKDREIKFGPKKDSYINC